MDNRVALALMDVLLRRLDVSRLQYDLFFGSTVMDKYLLDRRVSANHCAVRLGRCRHGPSQPQAVHAPAGGSDGGLAAHHTTARELRDQIHAPPRCREDASLRSEQPRRFLDCRGETAQPLRESGKDQVPDGMASDPADSREPVLEDPREWICAGRERHEAVADVARARKAIETAQLARASAVVAGRHDGGNLGRYVKSTRADQPAEDRGEPGSSTDGRDPQRPANRKRLR